MFYLKASYLCLECFHQKSPCICSFLKCKSPLTTPQEVFPDNPQPLVSQCLALVPLHGLVPVKSTTAFLLIYCVSFLIFELQESRNFAQSCSLLKPWSLTPDSSWHPLSTYTYEWATPPPFKKQFKKKSVLGFKFERKRCINSL